MLGRFGSWFNLHMSYCLSFRHINKVAHICYILSHSCSGCVTQQSLHFTLWLLLSDYLIKWHAPHNDIFCVISCMTLFCIWKFARCVIKFDIYAICFWAEDINTHIHMFVIFNLQCCGAFNH